MNGRCGSAWNWGSLDQELLARLMDENGERDQPWDASAVLREALVRSAARQRAPGRAAGSGGKPDLPVGQSERGAAS